MKNIIIIFIFILLIASFMSFALAQQEEKREKEVAYEAILAAKDHMSKMQAVGFSVKKANDTILEATALYEAQVALEEKTGSADYSKVIETANSVAEIRKEAFEVNDELNALNSRIEELSKSQDMSEAIAIFNEAKKEFEDERYEQAKEAIDRCYQKINELQATSTKIKAIYKASTKTLAGFFERNYKVIAVIVFIALIIYFIFRDKIALNLVKKGIERLQLEKETLAEMIKQTQFDYFQKGSMSESMYRVRETKFGELTRDIERRLSIERFKLEDIKKRKEKRAEKLKRIAHAIGLYKTKDEIQKAKLRKKEKSEQKRRKKLRIKAERKRAKLMKKEERKRRKEAKKRAKLRKKAEKKRLREAQKRAKELSKRRKKEEKRKKEKEKKPREEAEKEKEERKKLKKIDFGRIKNYVQRAKSRGFSDKQIKAELAKSGWKARLVKKAFREVEKEKRKKEKEARKRAKAEKKKEKEEHKRLEKIKPYIQKTKSKGFSNAQIKAELARRGWQSALIKKALSEVEEKESEKKADFSKVKSYILKARSMGLSNKKIKVELARSGWQRRFVKKSFKEIKKEKRKRRREEKGRLREEAARRKEEERLKAKATRLAERELAMRQKERKKQEKLARKKAIKRLKEVKKEFERRRKEALKRKKEEERKRKTETKKRKRGERKKKGKKKKKKKKIF